jgi:hypothetical protein
MNPGVLSHICGESWFQGASIRAIGARLGNLVGAIGSESANTGAAKSDLAEPTVHAAKEIKPEMPD